MRPGEAFEKRCYEYLKRMYNMKKSSFLHEGGMDSTKSDIAVIKNGMIDYYIETKDTTAQSGQFVLLPNENTQTFVFSPQNRSLPNEMTEIIIEYMNQDFKRFNNAGTTGEPLEINAAVFSNWIIEHYQDKNVKYVMSYKNGYVIFPIRRFASYFDIIAKYRIKKSGSSEPAKKDIPTVIQTIRKTYPSSRFSQDGKKLFVSISDAVQKDRFALGKSTYYLSPQSHNYYEVRKLSNTYNMNVIFSINLKKTQDGNDLNEFESDL